MMKKKMVTIQALFCQKVPLKVVNIVHSFSFKRSTESGSSFVAQGRWVRVRLVLIYISCPIVDWWNGSYRNQWTQMRLISDVLRYVATSTSKFDLYPHAMSCR